MVFGFLESPYRIIASPHFWEVGVCICATKQLGATYNPDILRATSRKPWGPGNPHPSNPQQTTEGRFSILETGTDKNRAQIGTGHG
jgi:hypothetical protein